MQQTLALHPPGFNVPSGEALSWYKGALGEIAVAGVLAWLPSEFTVLHSVPIGEQGTDIDHVVIGPPGVFTINTKSHPGQSLWIGGHGLLVSGQHTNYIGKAAQEASRASTRLSSASGLTVPVQPLIVFVNPGSRTVKALPEGGVRVLADWELLGHLNGLRREFSAEQLEEIAAAASRSETWCSAPPAVVDARRLAIHFNAIVARNLQGAQSADAPLPTPRMETRIDTVVPARGRDFVRAAPHRQKAAASRPRSRGRAKKSVWQELVKAALFIGVAWFGLTVGLPAYLATIVTP
ncbi:nuclease-related domain-containing protein [Amnibacterium flavum]|nr:nuclease-related domain-containing protein [Amnibacterium flavum]